MISHCSHGRWLVSVTLRTISFTAVALINQLLVAWIRRRFCPIVTTACVPIMQHTYTHTQHTTAGSRASSLRFFTPISDVGNIAVWRAASPVLGALPAAPTLSAVVQPPPPPPPPQLHGPTRKRPAPPPPQPECPVALRPIASCPTLSSQFMPHWTWLMPGLMRPPSPTLPAPPSLETTTTNRQEHEPTKWSNPSSVESNGLKTDSTAGRKSPENEVFVLLLNVGNIAPIAASLPIGHVHSITTPERKHRNDDYVKLIREQDLSEERISAIPIPVPQALSLDPNFRAVSEQQVVQQVVQNKRFEEVDVRESMTHLVWLKANGRNHSGGIESFNIPEFAHRRHHVYTAYDVCRKVLGDRFSSDDDFWESLRDSMRKLAARCRRVRHAKKTKSSREEGVLLSSERTSSWPEGSVAQTLQSLNLPTEKSTHTVQTMPIGSDRKKIPEISETKLAETLQSGLHALANATLVNQ
ncbi:unnamed protein product, partial [Strongylus vulgaris]